MIGANFKATLYLSNGLKTDPITVAPALYLSNGVRYALRSVTLEPSGTATVDINQALAEQGIAPYATLSGYVEVQYQWPWAAICATVRNVDTLHSLIFVYGAQSSRADAETQSPPTGVQQVHTLEGMWWKQEANVTGFVALSNITAQPIDATVLVTDNEDRNLADHRVTVTPHGTKIVELTELMSSATSTGALVLTHDGPEGGLAVNAGLQDPSAGYSAHLPVGSLPDPSGKVSEGSFAELGLMRGAADPMMNFPAGTVFTPYAVLRNVSGQPFAVTPTLWWMEGAAARSAQLSQFTVPPHRTQSVDVPSLIASAGLKNFNGTVNLAFDTKGQTGGLWMMGGSVDQSNTYVFEVMPRVVRESASKPLQYWSTGNGDDTMVTLWNPADEGQDFVFTLFYAGGQYAYPMHLGPRATQSFNISEIANSGMPDAEGNIVPAGVHEGSAEISGSLGENEHILVAMDAGIYNVRKAICGPPTNCETCNGFTSVSFGPSPFAVPVGGNTQLGLSMQYNTGNWYDLTGQSTWGSSNTGVATVNTGLVHGMSVGTATVSANDNFQEPVYISYCSYYLPNCPIGTGSPGGNGPGKVQVPTSLSLAIGAKTTYNGNNMIECNGTNDGPRWGYSRCGTFTLLDQDGLPITVGGFKASETVSTVSSNPAGLKGKIGGGQLTNGTFQDFWAFVATSSPAPAPGQYAKIRQSITITSLSDGTLYTNIRINCLDFESSDVTATDITITGSCQ
jgi:hypothetical protein